MAKNDRKPEDKSKEMSMAEAKALRVSMAKPQAPKELSQAQKREAFRLHWAKEKSKYGKTRDLEDALWLHLKAIKMDVPEKFDDGLKHFGLKKVE